MKRRKSDSSRGRIAAKIPTETKLVKSAGRVLEILEFFDDFQRPATVMEVAVALSYPQSSTSALLRSLVATGYLTYDAQARTYITSTRVALLGSWLNSPFFAEGTLISLMKELNELTGDTVVLATRNGLYAQYIHVIQATSPARLHLTLGTVRPLAASGAGYAILSTMTDAEITRIVMRMNAEAPEGQPLVKLRDLLADIEQVRERGYAFTYDIVTRGGGIMAVPLPRLSGQPLMVMGIGGISEIMRQREGELSQILLDRVASRFGQVPRSASGTPLQATDALSAAILRERMQARV
jgi:DNA-binding IclR family transcriptional regulator